MMLREISEGAPHLDLDTFALMRGVFMAFGRILSNSAAARTFQPVPPILAYRAHPIHSAMHASTPLTQTLHQSRR